jgi:Spy/CpxP family protein refolding chaperone
LATFAVGLGFDSPEVLVPTSSSLNRLTLVGVVTFLLAASPAHSQMAAPKPAAPPLRTTGSTPHQQPCWQQAGISKGVIEQRRSIEQNTRAQVESVCADSSLTPQQKHQKIKELREGARQQIDAIITPQQQEELKACNAQRATSLPAPLPHHGTGGRGPCGEMAANPTPAPTEGDHASGTPAPPQP